MVSVQPDESIQYIIQVPMLIIWHTVKPQGWLQRGGRGGGYRSNLNGIAIHTETAH